jgi:hypothetical protein
MRKLKEWMVDIAASLVITTILWGSFRIFGVANTLRFILNLFNDS